MSIKRKSEKSLAIKNAEFFSTLTNPQHTFSLNKIEPMTKNQESMFTAFASGANLFIHGYAGTGKTLLSLYLGLQDVLSKENKRDNIIILRSVVPSRDMGFLPGNAKEKGKIFELPYGDACAQLFERPNAYEALKTQKIINFTTTSFLRGLTFKNSVVYIDEIQNMCDNEIHTIMTRIGDGCRVIVSGDIRQSDLLKEPEKIGCSTFIKTISKMESFKRIEFGVEDILRSSFVKDYIVARANVLDEK